MCLAILVMLSSGCGSGSEAEPPESSGQTTQPTEGTDCAGWLGDPTRLSLPDDMTQGLEAGIGGGVPSPPACSGHFQSTNSEGRFINLVERRPPFTLTDSRVVGEYEVGAIEDGFLAVYVGEGQPDHYFEAYGVDETEFDALISSI